MAAVHGKVIDRDLYRSAWASVSPGAADGAQSSGRLYGGHRLHLHYLQRTGRNGPDRLIWCARLGFTWIFAGTLTAKKSKIVAPAAAATSPAARRTALKDTPDPHQRLLNSAVPPSEPLPRQPPRRLCGYANCDAYRRPADFRNSGFRQLVFDDGHLPGVRKRQLVMVAKSGRERARRK